MIESLTMTFIIEILFLKICKIVYNWKLQNLRKSIADRALAFVPDADINCVESKLKILIN